MPTPIDKIPFNQIPQDEAFHPVRGNMWRDIYNKLYQLRNRTGGDVDIIYSIQYDTTGLTALNTRMDSAEDEIDYLYIYGMLTQLNGKIASLIADNENLRTQLNIANGQLAALSQKLAEIENLAWIK